MSNAAELVAPGKAATGDHEFVKPMPGFLHSAVQPNLSVELNHNHEFRVFNELDLKLSGRLLRPDICLYPRKPMNWNREVPRVEEIPSLVVEILSVGQGYGDILERKDFYLEVGVKSFWLVFPPILAITIFTPDAEQQTFVHAGIITDPVLGVTADLAAVFS